MSDINEVINDPTKQLTQADIDPIGSASKQRPARTPVWVGGPKSTYETRHAALSLAVQSIGPQGLVSETIIEQAVDLENYLLNGASDGDDA